MVRSSSGRRERAAVAAAELAYGQPLSSSIRESEGETKREASTAGAREEGEIVKLKKAMSSSSPYGILSIVRRARDRFFSPSFVFAASSVLLSFLRGAIFRFLLREPRSCAQDPVHERRTERKRIRQEEKTRPTLPRCLRKETRPLLPLRLPLPSWPRASRPSSPSPPRRWSY